MKNKIWKIPHSKRYTKDELMVQADDIMRDFDFEKVKTTMTHLKWYWGVAHKAPSIRELKETAQDLLDNVIKDAGNDTCLCGTGGFLAEYHPQAGLSLKFIVEEAENYPE